MPLSDLHGVHVLAVDDEQDALSLVTEVLEAAGNPLAALFTPLGSPTIYKSPPQLARTCPASSTGRTKQADSWPRGRPAFMRVGLLGIHTRVAMSR